MTHHPSPAFETLEVRLDGTIGTLELARPDKLNPLSATCLAELAEAARWFDTTDARVVVVRGQGRCFSAGADLSTFAGPADPRYSLRDAADLGRLMADAIEGMKAVTIAAVRGWCVGGGLVLAAACDLRIAAADARFSIPEVDLGIPLAWGGIPRLVREIGPMRTKDLVMTCRPFGADEAVSAGFLTDVVEPDDLDGAVDELARSLAAKAPYTLWATKRHVDAVTSAMVGLDRSWGDADSLAFAFRDPACNEARTAYLAKRSAS